MRAARPAIFTTAPLTGLPELLRRETVGGVVMLAATVVALLWANLDANGYRAVQQTALGPLDLQHWAADGLLAVFFFVAGLELKRELTHGSLSRPAQAALPIIAAGCGMVVPAGLYLLVNLVVPGGDLAGWAVPMATDIAFALTVLAVAGAGLPTGLRAFLLTLAVVDDLGAILVIAVVFSHGIRAWWLLAAVGCVVAWVLLQRLGARVRVPGWVYVPVAVACWICTYSGGVHATIAGVALGLATRSRPSTGDVDRRDGGEPQAPSDRWDHRWRPVSAGVAVPLFALLSAGVSITPGLLTSLISSPVTLGIAAGLLVGKTVGVLGGTAITTRLTRATLPAGLRWGDVLAVAVLSGMGFTVALLMSELSFTGADVIEEAKAAVLVSSTLAAVLAVGLLRRRASVPRPADETATVV